MKKRVRIPHDRACPRFGMLPEDLEYARVFPEEYVCTCGALAARRIFAQAQGVRPPIPFPSTLLRSSRT